MLEERSQQSLLSPRPLQGVGQCVAELVDILRDEVGQIGVFRSVPYLLVGIEFGSVGWQPFDLGALSESLPGGATMDRVPIHNQDDRSPPQATQHRHDERHEVVSLDVVVEDVEVQAQTAARGRNGDRRDRRLCRSQL